MEIKSLRNCLIRFLMWTEDFEDCEKSEMNDLQMSVDGLIIEMNDLMKEE